MDQNNPVGVEDALIYQQAMETFRSILAQVVSTSGVLATGAVAVIAVAVERDSPAFVAVSSIFPLVMYLLFRRWRRFDDTVLTVAASLEVNRQPQLATLLRGWRTDASLVNYGPLLAAAALIIWSILWRFTPLSRG